MVSPVTAARAGHLALVALSPHGTPPDGFGQHKLNRLLELRAVIDSLRCEHEARDPLLSWVVEQEKAEEALTRR